MHTIRVPLKAVVVAVPLGSHIYEIKVSHDFYYGDSKPCFTGRSGINQREHCRSRWPTSVNDRTCYSAALSYDFEDPKEPDAFNMHIVFLSPAIAGNAGIEIKDVTLGAGISISQATLRQTGEGPVVA